MRKTVLGTKWTVIGRKYVVKVHTQLLLAGAAQQLGIVEILLQMQGRGEGGEDGSRPVGRGDLSYWAWPPGAELVYVNLTTRDKHVLAKSGWSLAARML